MVTLTIIAAIFGVCVIVMAAILTAAERRPVSTYDEMCEAIDRSLDGLRPATTPVRTSTTISFIPAPRTAGSVTPAVV